MKSDEKMMMDTLYLMYTLLKPEDVTKVIAEVSAIFGLPSLQQNLEAFAPHNSPVINQNTKKQLNFNQIIRMWSMTIEMKNLKFDILHFLANTEDNNQLILATTQVEQKSTEVTMKTLVKEESNYTNTI